MKKLFKKPVFWVILVSVVGLIVARIIQVRKGLKNSTTGAKLSAGSIAQAFFTAPIMTPVTDPKIDASSSETLVESGKPKKMIMGNTTDN